jgi:glucose/mannose-6-phosphate isomerase
VLDISAIKKFDSQGMYKIYDKWPEIAVKSFESNQESIDFGQIDHIVFAGMGGSGAIGDIFSAILSKTNTHVNVVKGYHLPKTVNAKTLVIAISISGNTDEIIRIIDLAYEQGCKLVVFTSGGKIKEICIEREIEFRIIEKFHSPRASFPSFLYSILNILSNVFPIEKNEILDSINQLQILQQEISSNNLTENNRALELAKWINKMPLIYYPFGLQSVAIRFKNSLQENSKKHVIVEDIVESCHNGIVAWEKKSEVQPILIKGVNDHVKTKEKFMILSEYFQENNIEFKEINSIKGNILSKIINLIYLLDYASIYKAVLDKIDPSPVGSITYVKNRIDEFKEKHTK